MRAESLVNLVARLRRAAAERGDGLTDADLLRRFRTNRDEAAFELLVWRHGPMVLRVCRRVLRDAHAAEDAFQATFLTLVRAGRGIRQSAALAGWLHRVATRVALRAKAVANHHPLSPMASDPPSPAPEETCPPEWLALLDAEIGRLPEKYRLPVVLCHLQGKTLAEAGLLLGCPRGTVAVRLARARARLRETLTRRGVTLAAVLGAASVPAGELSAALTRSTARAALGYAAGTAGAASAAAVQLTEGVIRSMWLTKLKIAGLIVVAFLAIPAGVGWAAYRAADAPDPGGQNPSVAVHADEGKPSAAEGGAADPLPAAQKEQPRDPAADREAQVQKAERLLQVHMKQLDAQEQQWLEEIVVAKSKVAELESRLKGIDVKLARARERTVDVTADAEVRALMDQRTKLRTEVGRMEKAGSIDAIRRLNELEKEIPAVEQKLVQRQREVTDAAEKDRDAVLQELLAEELKVRTALVRVQEEVRLLERRQERQREEAWREITLARQHLRELQSRGGNPAAPNSLDAKVDQLLREVTELRRELQKRPPQP